MAMPASSPERPPHADARLIAAGLTLGVLLLLAGHVAAQALRNLWLAGPPVFFVTSTIASIVVVGLHAGRQQALRARRAEAAKRAQGLAPYPNRGGTTRWGTPTEVEAYLREEAKARERASQFGRLREVLDRFQPSMGHPFELPYHMELLGYLRAYFPEARPEVQRGSSRPDIVVAEYAVEVKGPTGMEELRSIADKCMRYPQHFERVFLVVFDVRVTEPFYEEWARGLRRTFPGVVLLRKWSPPRRGP